jgi:hypothetical protein
MDLVTELSLGSVGKNEPFKSIKVFPYLALFGQLNVLYVLNAGFYALNANRFGFLRIIYCFSVLNANLNANR